MQTIQQNKIGRNDPCSCGSGLKFKKCCINGKNDSILSIHKNITYSITYDPLPCVTYEKLTPEDASILMTINHDLLEKHYTTEELDKYIIQLEIYTEKYKTLSRVYNLLYACYQIKNEDKKSLNILFEMYEKFPDYVFAKINLANHFILNGQHKKVADIFENKYDLKLLYPERDIFHITEFTCFMATCGRYFIREGDVSMAKIFLNTIKKHTDNNYEFVRCLESEIEIYLKKHDPMNILNQSHIN